jgi:cyclic pyranopterin phosphate synthase
MPGDRNNLSHIDSQGNARMVDVSRKAASRREATAQAMVTMAPQTVEAIRGCALSKGDALAVARVAGILAAKRVDETIPLCHTVPLSDLSVDFEFEQAGIRIVSRAVTIAQTGVEMEALIAASTAALTIYDMAKGIDKRMTVTDLHLLSKSGGRSGDFYWTDRSE